ncbi:MAG: Lrp/AsnC family transcriptional regulator [Gammaproteobacteria bacterium]|nr:Lrp/AsnC family transcriptional regulator [Gammaproteobacteria bacterium]
MELDAIDRRILDLLQNDGRISNADLAEKIHLSPSACLRRVKRLEESGVIESYAMLLNPAKIGRKSTIFVEISLNSQSETSLEPRKSS